MGDKIVESINLGDDFYFLIESEMFRSVGGELKDTLVAYRLAKVVLTTPYNIQEKEEK